MRIKSERLFELDWRTVDAVNPNSILNSVRCLESV